MFTCAVLVGLMLASCGGSGKPKIDITTVASSESGPTTAVVVRVGATPITKATYDHWMAIGAATVEMPKPTAPLPKPIAYEPPDFTACVARQRVNTSKASTAQLRATCKKTYEGVQARILNVLISGYWLRGEASERHESVTGAEVRAKFEEEKRVNYPGAASFRRLQEASRQTVPDLEFAVETQMLSARLLEKFTKAHSHEKSERATITAFNKSIKDKWIPRTSCAPGYVVPDCKQYRPPKK
jgi:hypothetical protein